MHCAEPCRAANGGRSMLKPRSATPAYRPNIYSTRAIVDPYPHYAQMRRLGPVVWLSRHRVSALPRYAECQAVLRDDATFISGHGVALNALTNRLSREPPSTATAPNTISAASLAPIGCCHVPCATSAPPTPAPCPPRNAVH